MTSRSGAPQHDPSHPAPLGRPGPVARAYSPNALPSVVARGLAFLAILLGGLCGGLIGYAITDLQCGAPEASIELDEDGEPVRGAAIPERDPEDAASCRTLAAVGGLIGAAVGAGGVAVVSVLVLRAMAEWRRELEIDDGDDLPAAGSADPAVRQP